MLKEMLTKMRWTRLSSLGLLGFSIVGLMGGFAQGAIANTCVAQTSCTAQPIQFKPGSWVNFEVVNSTSTIIGIEQPNSAEPIYLNPGESMTLGGTSNRNTSLLFWDPQGLSLQARLQQVAYNKLRVELRWGNGFGHDSLYLKDDGRIELH